LIKTYLNNTKYCLGDICNEKLLLQIFRFYIDLKGLYIEESMSTYTITTAKFNDEMFFYSDIVWTNHCKSI
jgi:hypothetical protein